MDNDVKIKVSVDGAEQAEKGLRGIGDGASDSDSKLSRLVSGGLKGVAIGAAALLAGTVAAGAGLWNMAKGAADVGDRVDEMSQKLGLSYQAYQEWDYIMSQSGVSIDALKGSLQKLSVATDEAIQGTGMGAEAFARLGISVDELRGKSREDIFDLTIKALQGVTDQTERAAIAQDLLGRGASELAPLLNQGAGSIEEMRQKAQELGLVLSDEAIKAGDEFNDSLDTLKRTAQGVKNTLGAELLPGLTEISLGLSGLLAGTDGAEQRIKDGANTLTSSLETVLPKVLSVLSTILEGVALVAPSLIGSLVQGITDNLPTLIGTVTDAAVSLVGILAAQAPGLISAGAQAIVALVTGVAGALPTLIPTVVKGIIGVVGALIEAAPLLLDAGIQLVQGLATGILDSIPIIIDMLPMLIDGIVNFIITGVPLLLDAGVQLFTGLIEALPEVITQLVAVLPEMITSVITALVGLIPLIVQAGVQLLTALVTNLPLIIQTIVAALPQIITAVVGGILGALPLLVQAGIDLFVALIGALPQIIITIVGALPQIINAVIDGLIGAIPQLILAGVQLLTAIITNMPLIVGTIVGAIPQIISGIIGALSQGISQMVNMGGNFVRGIWDGISGAAGWLFNQIAGFVDDVMSNIASFFGIASPAKRLRNEIGRYLPPGIGEGVEAHEQEAIRPIQRMNERIMDEAQRLNTNVAFSTQATLTQTLVPMRLTPQDRGPVMVEARFDEDALGAALSAAFGDGGDDGAPIPLDRASLDYLADRIVEGLKTVNRTGVVTLG